MAYYCLIHDDGFSFVDDLPTVNLCELRYYSLPFHCFPCFCCLQMDSQVASPELLNKLQSKGKELFDNLSKSLSQCSAQQTSLPKLPKHYMINIGHETALDPNEHWNNIDFCLNHANTGYYHVGVHGICESSNPIYGNYIHGNGDLIICMFNFRCNDLAPETEQMHWSDMMTACCAELMDKTKGRMTNLKAI